MMNWLFQTVMTIRGHRTRRAESNGIFISTPVKNGLRTLLFSADEMSIVQCRLPDSYSEEITDNGWPMVHKLCKVHTYIEPRMDE
jgi:hypothetical protein